MELKHLVMLFGAYWLYKKSKEKSPSGQAVVRDLPPNQAPAPEPTPAPMPIVTPIREESGPIYQPGPVKPSPIRDPISIVPLPMPPPAPPARTIDISQPGPMNTVTIIAPKPGYGIPVRRILDPKTGQYYTVY